MKKYLLTAIAVTIMTGTSIAQFVVFNNGAEVTVSQGCIVTILTGDLNNDSGTIDNSGRITVDGDLTNDDQLSGGGGSTGIFSISGDWENNSTFTADQSLVNLTGADQNITGSAVSAFYDLHLLGSGIKIMDLDAEVSNLLELNDRELATMGNTMRLLNPSNLTVSATTGFVSSTGNGRLSWDMNTTDTYVFPLGSSAGTPRIRPVAITPTNASANTFAARMANVDATTEGFDVNQLAPDLCMVNDAFYHQIDHVSGSDAADVTQYFDAVEDGDWQNGAHWQNTPQWEDMGNEALGVSGSYTTVTNPGWTDFSQPAFALANTLPDVSFDAVAPLCEQGNPVALSATPSGGTFAGSGVSNGMFDPVGAGSGTHTVSYTYTDILGCTNSASIDIEVSGAVVVEVTSSTGSLELCDGESLDLTATAGFTAYDWNPTGSTSSITVTTGGQYSVTVTDANGCEGTSAIANVTVHPAPNPVATADGPTAFCEGETVTLSTAPGMGSYLWSITNSITPSTVVTGSGDYFVTVTDQFGCEGVSNTITVDVTPMVQATIVENGNMLTVDPPGTGYQWFLNGDPIPGANGIDYTAIQSGNYHVEYIGANGCPTSTNILEFTLHIGIAENSIFNALDLFPNPGKGQFTIRGLLPTMEDVTIVVTNMLGQSLQPAIRIDATNDFTQTMDISRFANGVYFIRLEAADSFVTVRYIKS